MEQCSAFPPVSEIMSFHLFHSHCVTAYYVLGPGAGISHGERSQHPVSRRVHQKGLSIKVKQVTRGTESCLIKQMF